MTRTWSGGALEQALQFAAEHLAERGEEDPHVLQVLPGLVLTVSSAVKAAIGYHTYW